MMACWKVDGQAESEDSWPAVIVQSTALDIIDTSSGSVIRSLDLSRPESENVFEYYSPGWNVTQAWLKKRNTSCAWIPMCYLMEQLSQLRGSAKGPLSASLSILADKVPPTKAVDLKDARVVIRAVAAEGEWATPAAEEPKEAETEASQLPIGAILSPPVASIDMTFGSTPLFSFELPKPSETFGMEGQATGYAVLASAESTGLTFEFGEDDWAWVPESVHPAYGRILDQLKTFDDRFQDNESDGGAAEDEGDDYEASAVALFNAKRDLPIRVNEWTYIPRFVLETVGYTPERSFVMQKCLSLGGLSTSLDPLSATVFEMLYNTGDATEASVQLKTFMEAAPIQAMVSSQDGASIFDLRTALMDEYSKGLWTLNVSLSKIYPAMRGSVVAEALDGDVGCTSCYPWRL
eukprot:Protomagalhaensia_wolfi_Nauph_80__7@NODE_1006_length_1816_cov_209_657288_g662_i1_p1_GENE_NODE_1006_length_1816_cov_209_657288_g662_i1NODE_1006_length_1816_cov_209_657288_g662_i1_p1_ORF_typecomplete_len407_score84_73_NODE_1006_length_1816_cov_209_657288_g662_i1901310